MANRVGALKVFGSETTDSVGSIDTNNNTISAALNDASLGYVNGIATDTGSVNNYILTCPFGSPTGYNQGMMVAWIPGNTNTGPSTITVNPQPSAPLVDAGGNALAGGAIQAGVQAAAIYNGGSFRLLTVPGAAGGLLYKNVVITTVGTTTIPCGGASIVSIILDSGTAPLSSIYTLTLTGVLVGAHIDIHWFMGGASQQLKFANCTDSLGNTITNIRSGDWANGSHVNTDLTAAQGWGGNSVYFIGFCFRDSTLTYIKFLDFWV